MSDDETEAEKIARITADWNQKLSTGEPVHTFHMSEILRADTSPEGAASIDFVFAGSLDNQAVVARLIIEPEAARALKAALVANENILDTPPPKRDQRAKQ